MEFAYIPSSYTRGHIDALLLCEDHVFCYLAAFFYRTDPPHSVTTTALRSSVLSELIGKTTCVLSPAIEGSRGATAGNCT